MPISNLYAWNHKAQNVASSACGASDQAEEKPAACGSACGAGDETSEKATACGAGDQ